MPGAVRTSLVQHLAGMVVDQNVGVGGIEVRTMQDTTRARALRQIAIGGALGIAVFRTRGLGMTAFGLHGLRMAAFRLRERGPVVFGLRRLGTAIFGLHRLRITVFWLPGRGPVVCGFRRLGTAMRGLGMVFGWGRQRRFGRNIAQRERQNHLRETDRSETTEAELPNSSSRGGLRGCQAQLLLDRSGHCVSPDINATRRRGRLHWYCNHNPSYQIPNCYNDIQEFSKTQFCSRTICMKDGQLGETVLVPHDVLLAARHICGPRFSKWQSWEHLDHKRPLESVTNPIDQQRRFDM